MFNKFKLLKKEEYGQALIEVTFLLLVLLGFSALIIDVGYIAYQKSYLQTAADSAALAGAMEIPKSADDSQVKGVVVKKFADLNNLDYSKPLNIVSEVDRKEGTVKVDITQEVPKFFSSVISSYKYSLTVHAKAKYYMDWSGEALPFINLDDDYTQEPKKIVAWEKTAPGDFESIWKDDFSTFYGGKKDDHSQTYFSVDYKDGITITEGTVANIKDEVGYVYNQHKNVYVFSLSSAVINSGMVKLVNDPYLRSLSNLKNEDIIAPDQIVLLECTFDSYGIDGKSLSLSVLNVYDISHNVFPDNYVNPHEKVASRLVE